MEFALTSDQTLLQQSLQKALETEAPLDSVKRWAAEKAFAPASLWKALSEFGVSGLLIAEEWGGAGLKLLDAALAAEMLGRHVAPAPYVANAVMAPVALQIAGSAEQKRTWLPKIASGAARASVAVSGAASGERAAGVTSHGGKLTGNTFFALDAAGADVFIVGDTAGEMHLVTKDAKGLEVIALTTIDQTRSVAELRFIETPSEPLNAGANALVRTIDAGRVVLAADTLGAASAMLEKAVAYAQQREQFGRVIGSFQAVKHMCAEMAAEIEPARALIWYAGYVFDETPAEASRMAAHAKAHMSEAGTFVARTATEVHGGIGITELLGLHYWFKRIGFNRQALGGPERLRAEAAKLEGWAA